MRKTVIYNTGETIRFRCWNRKGYAIFRSLHRHVTIGRVCKSIADSALKKDKNTLNLENRRGGVDFRMQTEEEDMATGRQSGTIVRPFFPFGIRVFCGYKTYEYPGSPCHVFSFICHP